MNSSLTEKLPTVLPEDLAYAVIQSSEFVNHGLPVEYKEATLRVYVQALQLIWYVLIPMSGLGLIASCFVKHYSIRKQKEMRGELPSKDEQPQVQDEVVVVNIPLEDSNDKNTSESKKVESEYNNNINNESVSKKTEIV